jgi:mannose-1-phosphate guanylyltransferase
VNPQLHAAVLAGGSGTRFWPASTHELPKQFLPLLGDEPLLRRTIGRLDGLVPPERVLVVTAERSVAAARAAIDGLDGVTVLGEPQPRNTAAACALAAHWVRARDPDATLVVLPADHVADPAEELRDALGAAAERADAARSLVTLGLRPTRPATGYGWIHLGDEIAQARGRAVHGVRGFREKPDRETAESYLADGGYLWNLGMFAWRADVFLEEIARHRPAVAEPLRRAAGEAGAGPTELQAAYEAAESISVDYAVLEASDRLECLPCTFAWDDLGSFPALARHVQSDEHGNAAVGPLLAVDAANCIGWSDGDRLTALLGVEDLVVVHANGVTLVAARERAEEVKRLVERLGEDGLERFA